MKPKTMMIDDVKYVREDSIKSTTPIDESTEPLRIIMNDDRGLCLVGNVNLDNENWLVEIKNARCIIRWGTKSHLAELADKGILAGTSFGHAYTHKMPRSKIALVLECNMENW